jgi:hypothetical protein
MTRILLAGLLAFASLVLTGCASVAVMHSTHEDELQKLYPGEPRREVQGRLGAPAAREPLANGWSQDQHELRLRDDDAALYAVADVLSLGTLSMAEGLNGRPRDPIYRISVVYNQEERLVCARATRVSRENFLFKRMLPADGVIAGRCPA